MTMKTIRPVPAVGQEGNAAAARSYPTLALRKAGAAALAALVMLSIALAGRAEAATPVESAAVALSADLPPCAADYWVDGLAVERFDNGDFKVVLTPTVDARTHGTLGVYSMWHVVQACVPGLYDELADSIYGQLACHADLSAAPGLNGEAFATGPTWDFESWRPAYNELESIVTKCSAGWSSSDPYGGSHSEPGTWEVYFGVDPIEKSEQDIERIKAERDAAASAPFEQSVYVIMTGGEGLWTRTGPGYDADRIQVLPDGTSMTLLCQVHSQLIVDWMSSDLWDFVRLGDGQEVWVSDVFVKTGSDGQVAPTC